MKILVTGGAGFIGSHLCEYLLNKGNVVICVDNLFTGSKENIKPLFQNPNFKFIPHDIITPLHLQEHVDQIYNLACPASPVHYQLNPVKTIQANTVGVVNMLEMAQLHKARILQASTSEVYGDPLEHPQKESYRGHVNPIGPRACYDEGKRVAEALFFDYNRQHSVDIRVVRIFNTYGPKMAMNDGRVVSNFIINSLQGKDLPIYGDGSQSRSFCFVEDLIDGMYKMMNCEDVTGPINLGNPYEFSMKELAEIIIKLTGSNSKMAFSILPEDDPKQRQPNISLAKDKLKWEPKVQLEEGLKKTIDYFKKQLN